MELTGKIIEILKEQKGESARGHWRKQEYVLETGGQYPKKVCFMVWGEKISDFAIKEGEESLSFTKIPEPPNIEAPTSNKKIPLISSLDIFFSSFKIFSYTFVT